MTMDARTYADDRMEWGSLHRVEKRPQNAAL